MQSFIAATAVSLLTVYTSYAIDQVWQFKADTNEVVLESYVGSTVVALSTTQGIIGLDAKSGSKIWRHAYPEGRYVIGLPVMGEDVAVYWTYRDKIEKANKGDSTKISGLTAVDLTNGHVLWRFATPDFLFFGKTIENGRLFLSVIAPEYRPRLKEVESIWETEYSQRKGKCGISCRDLRTGVRLWSYEDKKWLLFLETLQDRHYLVRYRESIGGLAKALLERSSTDESGSSTDLLAISPETGKKLWTFESAHAEFVALLPRGDELLVISSGNRETASYLLKAENGKPARGLFGSHLFLGAAYHTIAGDTLRTFGRILLKKGWSEILATYDIHQFKEIGRIRTGGSSRLGGFLETAAEGLVGRFAVGSGLSNVLILTKWVASGTYALLPKGKYEQLLLPNETPNAEQEQALFVAPGLYVADIEKEELRWRMYDTATSDNDNNNKPGWTVTAKVGNERRIDPIMLASLYKNLVVTGYKGGLWTIDPNEGPGSLRQIQPVRSQIEETLGIREARDGFIVTTTAGAAYYR